jgi:hypothetical protein
MLLNQWSAEPWRRENSSYLHSWFSDSERIRFQIRQGYTYFWHPILAGSRKCSWILHVPKMPVRTYKTTGRHNPEDKELHFNPPAKPFRL